MDSHPRRQSSQSDCPRQVPCSTVPRQCLKMSWCQPSPPQPELLVPWSLGVASRRRNQKNLMDFGPGAVGIISRSFKVGAGQYGTTDGLADPLVFYARFKCAQSFLQNNKLRKSSMEAKMLSFKSSFLLFILSCPSQSSLTGHTHRRVNSLVQ